MLKSIKKSFIYFISAVAGILLLTLVLVGIVRIPAVQTYIVKGITQYISKELNSTISVGAVEFFFFNRLTLREILIKDQNNDTLLYSPRVTAGIRQYDRKNGAVRLGKINVSDPVFALITDSSGIMNLTWYLDKIRKPADSTKTRNALIQISRIDIINGRFALVNRINKPTGTPVNFNDLRIDSIFGMVENLTVCNDSTTMEINDLVFREKSGFRVKGMDASLLLNRQHIVFTDATISCGRSEINASRLAILADSAAAFQRFAQEVKLRIDLEKSIVNSSDLRYFVPFIKDINESVWISGRVSGTVSELKGRDIKLSYKDSTSLDCDFDFSGLPDIKNTFIFLEINDFRSISKDIEQISLPGKGNIMLPELLRKLGVVSFSGTFTGFTTDFVTYGKLNTTKGLISTDISLRPEEGKRFRIKGIIKGSDIDLGSIAGSKLLGRLTVETNVDGYTDAFKTFSAGLTGRIDSVEINSYIYRNILLNGYFTDKAWDGNIKIEDRNIQMDLLGRFDFNNVLPEFDFTLNLQKASLHRLNIARLDTTSSASMLLTANFTGNSFDNLDGEIKLLNSNFRKYGNNLEIYDFSLKTSAVSNIPSISLRTDFVDAKIDGHYNFKELGYVVRNVLAALIPSKYSAGTLPIKKGDNNFTFTVTSKNTDALNSFLRTGLLIAENSTLTGSVYADSLFILDGNSKSFSVNNNVFKDLQLYGKFTDSILNVNVISKSFNLSGLSDMNDLSIRLDIVPDNFNIGLEWDNKDKVLNKGSFSAHGEFTKALSSKGKTLLKVDLLPGQVIVRNELWKINPAEVVVDSNSVRISRFNVVNNENYFLVEGAVSGNTDDTLYMRFNGLEISPVNSLYEKRMNSAPDMIRLSLGGTLNGKISFTDVYRNFMFESDILLKDFTLLENRYGNIKIGSVWNNSRKVAEITANNDLDGVSMFDISGFYDPGTKEADLTAKADKLPVDVLNPLLKMFASGISGFASGTVKLTGELSKPVLTGSLWGENASMKIDYIQSRFRFSDSIRFDRNGIRFNNIQLKDEKGNTASLNGTVYHKHFKDFSVDLTVRTNDCMVLNTRSKDNELFYGTAYASGVTTIKSAGPALRFDISAKTGKNTRFFIPLNSGMSVAENNFVTFAEPVGKNEEKSSAKKQQAAEPASARLEIAFDLEVTPDAEVQLIMDPKAGDIMKATGRGNLNTSLDRKGAFRIFGDYIIENGDYLFTLGNIINKSFSVENGGKISFNGDVENADIDIKAIYKTKASLYDIMPGILPESKQSERIPVECQLLLTGKLFNPVVGFDIYLPTADEETRAYLKTMIKSEEDMSRQFLFLLVMNSFYADPTASSQSNANMGSTTVGVTTMEMLSNQLSNWLSQISNDFDIGVVYRPGSTALPNSQELQVALSTQFLNDKVVINGNFDVAGNQTSSGSTGSAPGTNTITGAFDVEYKINEKIRFKFFNRSNDNFYIDNGIQYTQGISLFYRQDFNKLKDLFRKREKSDMKKEEENASGKK